jgi:hypothetical protein
MKRKPDGSALSQLVPHLAMGASLGAALALALLFTGASRVGTMLMNAPEPVPATLLFISCFASMIAAGATITGVIFEQVERGR